MQKEDLEVWQRMNEKKFIMFWKFLPIFAKNFRTSLVDLIPRKLLLYKYVLNSDDLVTMTLKWFSCLFFIFHSSFSISPEISFSCFS